MSDADSFMGPDANVGQRDCHWFGRFLARGSGLAYAIILEAKRFSHLEEAIKVNAICS